LLIWDFFLAVLILDLRVLPLLIRHFTIWTILLTIFTMILLRWPGPWPSYFKLSAVTEIGSMCPHTSCLWLRLSLENHFCLGWPGTNRRPPFLSLSFNLRRHFLGITPSYCLRWVFRTYWQVSFKPQFSWLQSPK
jgi:hypothetical protein